MRKENKLNGATMLTSAGQGERLRSLIMAMKRFFFGAGLFTAGIAIGFALAMLIVARDPGQPPGGPIAASPATLVTFAATIDGSDRFVFTRDGVVHEHGRWQPPQDVSINGEPWTDLSATPTVWTELAGNLDLQRASLVSRKGRDLMVLERTTEGFALYFADTQMGSAPYEGTISIPRR